MKKTLAVVFVMCLVSKAGIAGAQTFRCKDRVVSTGENKAEVLLKCGEPFMKETTEVRTFEEAVEKGFIKKDDSEMKKRFETEKKVKERIVTIDKWYYSPGAGEFMRILTFKGGELVDIEEGERM